MPIRYAKSKWEMGDAAIEPFLERVKKDGFDATEIYLETESEKPDRTAALHSEYGLELVCQIITAGRTPDDHIRSFEVQFKRAVDGGAVAVNSHTGRDIFSFADNVRIISTTIDLAKNAGVPLRHETHRGRPTYSAVETAKLLDEIPGMRLTADFSHWMVVHESDLSDQEENVRKAISRSDQIHARVGYAEGPQVPDHRAPEWKVQVENHLRIWQKIVDAWKKDSTAVLFITPEFGPPDYMHTIPFSKKPVADAWEVNVYMRDFLRDRLRL